MTTRALAWIAIAVAGTFLLCSGFFGIMFTGGGNGAASCYLPIDANASPQTPPADLTQPPGGYQAIGQYNNEQVGNAATIVTVGARMGVPPHGWVIAVAAAIQESSLINVPGGPDDSIGLFQQRPSAGWGTPDQLHDPAYAATKFYARLLTIDGWQAMPLTEAAQAVQTSAYPDAYAKWETNATTLVSTLTGLTTELDPCGVSVSAQGWTQPVKARVGSGFRTRERPDHDGVDLSVGKGTPIHAAADGTVSRVRCDVEPASHGCDRDGSPQTPGCGWYVDIDHSGGVVTRYCHMLTQPAVTEGQTVRAGDVIGVSGSSGHSSGPHLHYEVHLGDHSSATATDPVAFMASVGAPLG